MKTIRYYLRLLLAFLVKFRGLLILGVVIGVLLFFLSRIFISIFLSRSIETIGITGRFNTETLPNYILEMISFGLTSIDESGNVIPAIAYSWETPDKGKTWTFNIKENVLWQDGTKIESDDILYEFTDVEIEKPDPKTIVFKLADPFVPFPSVVSRPTFKKGLLGIGPWQVKTVSISGNVIQKLVLVDKNKNSKIFKFYPTEESTKLAYKLGEVDKIIDIFVPSPLDLWQTTESTKEPNKDRVVLIFFNVQDKILGEKSVRQALIYSIDKNNLGGQRAISTLQPDSWSFNPQVKKYDYDVDRAKKLIDDLPDELKNNLKIKLVSSPILLHVAEDIAKYWQSVDIDTVVQVSSIVPKEFQAYLTILDIPKDPDQYSLWHSTQTETNISRYSSPRIDKLLEDGRTELNIEDRKKIYLDFQRFLVEDSPAAFLYYPNTFTISRK